MVILRGRFYCCVDLCHYQSRSMEYIVPYQWMLIYYYVFLFDKYVFAGICGGLIFIMVRILSEMTDRFIIIYVTIT